MRNRVSLLLHCSVGFVGLALLLQSDLNGLPPARAGSVRGGAICYTRAACLPTTSCVDYCSNDPLNKCSKNTTRSYTTLIATKEGTGATLEDVYCTEEKCVYPIISKLACTTPP